AGTDRRRTHRRGGDGGCQRTCHGGRFGRSRRGVEAFPTDRTWCDGSLASGGRSTIIATSGTAEDPFLVTRGRERPGDRGVFALSHGYDRTARRGRNGRGAEHRDKS